MIVAIFCCFALMCLTTWPATLCFLPSKSSCKLRLLAAHVIWSLPATYGSYITSEGSYICKDSRQEFAECCASDAEMLWFSYIQELMSLILPHSSTGRRSSVAKSLRITLGILML